MAGTIGAKKRPFSKEIIEQADIESLCMSVTGSKEPIAPRLSGTFLLGLVEIYSQKCTYYSGISASLTQIPPFKTSGDE